MNKRLKRANLKPQPIKIKVISVEDIVEMHLPVERGGKGLSLRDISKLKNIHYSKVKRIYDEAVELI